jgi:hypothetical protein
MSLANQKAFAYTGRSPPGAEFSRKIGVNVDDALSCADARRDKNKNRSKRK